MQRASALITPELFQDLAKLKIAEKMYTILSPPVLPSFLADVFDLKPIEGVPDDEAVKMVHAAIRALGEVANVPRLYDAGLAMKLSQHLFSIQMTRYRETHPCVILPSINIHTPPTLPAHINVELQPVHGAPSDKEIISSQKAMRLYESMASVPSMFDPNLGASLSQHLFNIRFERYIHQVANGHVSIPTGEPQDENPGEKDTNSNNNKFSNVQQADSNVLQSQLPLSGAESFLTCASSGASDNLAEKNHPETIQSTESQAENNRGIHVGAGTESTNQLLVQIGKKLDDIKRFMVGAQHSSALGWNATKYSDRMPYSNHALVNAQGETIGRWSHLHDTDFRRYLVSQPESVNSSTLVQYLQLYGIESDFIDHASRLKEDKKVEAISAVKEYLGI